MLLEFLRRDFYRLAFVNRLYFANPLALRGELVDVPLGLCRLGWLLRLAGHVRQYWPQGKYVQSWLAAVTEHRIDEMFTVYECNHRGPFDPEYVGFSIKGVRHLFHEVGLAPDGVYTLAEIINRIVSYRPGSAVSELLRIIFNDYKTAGDLEVNLAAAV